MKFLISLLIAALMLFHCAAAATPEEEARFLSAVRDAYTKKDKDAIIALTCWDHVTEQDKKMAPKVLDYAVSFPIKAVQYRPLDPAAGQTFVRNGVTFGPNLPITKQIELVYAAASGLSTSELFVGEKGGKLFIVNLAPQP